MSMTQKEIDRTVAKLHRTRQTIANFMARTPGATLYDNHLCGLVDRYEDLKSALTHNCYDAWRAYCEECGSDLRHDGHDLIS